MPCVIRNTDISISGLIADSCGFHPAYLVLVLVGLLESRASGGERG